MLHSGHIDQFFLLFLNHATWESFIKVEELFLEYQ